jgi:hypothetical protein
LHAPFLEAQIPAFTVRHLLSLLSLLLFLFLFLFLFLLLFIVVACIPAFTVRHCIVQRMQVCLSHVSLNAAFVRLVSCGLFHVSFEAELVQLLGLQHLLLMMMLLPVLLLLRQVMPVLCDWCLCCRCPSTRLPKTPSYNTQSTLQITTNQPQNKNSTAMFFWCFKQPWGITKHTARP